MDLYNLERPRKFQDMAKTSSFMNNITARIDAELQGKPGMAHCFLLYSPDNGVGKTTASRIFASEMNPDISDEEREALFTGQDNPVCIHINGGDKRKIEDIRQMVIERVEALMTPLYDYRYVFIIDEVHKLTSDSVDALLAPIENCPANVFFFLTTTDVSRMSNSKGEKDSSFRALFSRCELHQFKPLNKGETVKFLNEIITARGMVVNDQKIVEQIYDVSGGKPRKAIILLNQFAQTGVIGAPEEEQEDDAPYFDRVLKGLIEIANGRGKGTWIDILPRVRHMIDSCPSAEDARIRLMQRAMSIIMEPAERSTYEAVAIQIVTDALREPVSPPQKSDLVSRLYSAAVKIAIWKTEWSSKRKAKETSS